LGRIARARRLEGSEMARDGGMAAGSPLREALPFVAAATLAALLLLIPAYVVPRERMSDVLEGHAAQFTLAVGMAFILVALFFTLRFLG
jgi:hypothetical protein